MASALPPSQPHGSAAPSGDPWRNRGYLPHFDPSQALQAITYRLADSLPATVVERLDAECPDDEVERRRRIDAWLDAGHGACILRDPELAACVIDAWKHHHGQRYMLQAWVVMPNHVHVLIRMLGSASLAQIVWSWKSWTARRLGRGAWQREYWDRYIRDETHYRSCVDYIHGNPVKAGLCRQPEEWPWSSAAPGSAALLCGSD